MAENMLQGCKLMLTYLYHHRITITHTILEFSFSSSLLPYAYIFATLFLAYGLLRTIFSLVIRGKWYVVNGHYTGRNGLVIDDIQTVVRGHLLITEAYSVRRLLPGFNTLT